MTAILPQGAPGPERAKTRLDQWLWFARLAKSRSLAARLCAAGAVKVNGVTVSKPNQTVRIGDCVVVPQGGVERTVRVLALGTRRGPSREARALYGETAGPTLSRDPAANWVPLLGDDLSAYP
ncbi:MAG TPA: RNA-binding S4 domain-containing protein [Stellaceae bacterium]|nr:RNA-binding S4 domain-containing protein [Stellaceae bacterium]